MALTSFVNPIFNFNPSVSTPKGETVIIDPPMAVKQPTTRKLGGKEGRPQEIQYGSHFIQCPCTLKTEGDRLYCNDWRSNRQSTDCLYLVGNVHEDEQLHCWLGLRK